jgi:DNA-binding CsgD family transcriptional regulator
MGDPASDSLIGRDAEIKFIREFIDRSALKGGSLLVSGDPGVGKTALLKVAARQAEEAGFRVVGAAGAEFEAELSFAGLNMILHPLLGDLGVLSPLYRQALSVALGLEAGQPSDRLVLANAVLELFREASRSQPLLVVVDDLPWLDRASALVLGSVVRRLEGACVGFLAAMRTESESFFDRAGLPSYQLHPLDQAASRELLKQRYPALTPRVSERLIIESKGNALALLELPIALEGAGSVQHDPSILPLTQRLLDIFASRISELPTQTVDRLLMAVLAGTGDLQVLEAAAATDSLLSDLAPAERAQIVYIDESARRLGFRHPLIRSAVVAISTSDQRRRAHLSLAASMSAPERRAWHLAEAAVAPDESVAALLESVAHDHLNRGDAVRAIAEMSRAAELSPEPVDQARRWAEAAYIGATVLGDIRNATRVLDDVRKMDPDHAGSLAGAVAAAYQLLNGDGDLNTAHRLLVGAIESQPDSTNAHDEVLVEAIYNLLEVCFFGGREDLWPPFRRAMGRLEPHPPEFLGLLAKTIPDPARDAVTVLERLEDTIDGLLNESSQTRIIRIAVASAYVERLPLCRAALWRIVHDGRHGGAVTMSIHAMALLGFDDFLAGQWDSLEELADEGIRSADTHDYQLLRWVHRSLQALLAAARGDSEEARSIIDEVMAWAVPRQAGAVQAYVLHARTLDAIARTDFETAYGSASAISPAGTIASHVPHAMWVVLDLVEAATRTGRRDEAIAHAAEAERIRLPAISSRLALITYGAGAIASRVDADALVLFKRALDVQGAEKWPFDAARVRLAYGERLRRMKEKAEARVHLTSARETFQRLGARPWELRAATELRATGITIGQIDRVGPGSLTPQQLEIARLASVGLTNKEIGERLHLSHRTVGAHLYQVFPKLGIRSRAALGDAIKDLIQGE